ncbi:hypothetical protein KSF78_0008480 [Schistosoma japonicum]|nr:hypothetical protein KSF78_0008480 [Schistosoma japonicum]
MRVNFTSPLIESFRKFHIEYLDYLDVNENKNKINENMIKMNDSIDALNKRIETFEELENVIDKYGVKNFQCPKDKCKKLETNIPYISYFIFPGICWFEVTNKKMQSVTLVISASVDTRVGIEYNHVIVRLADFSPTSKVSENTV